MSGPRDRTSARVVAAPPGAGRSRRQPPAHGVPVLVWFGGGERDAPVDRDEPGPPRGLGEQAG
jgi:hypothetical protein